MSWKFLRKDTVQHTSGLRVTLKSGSWSIPYDIEPDIPRQVPGFEAVALIREGLEYAAIAYKTNESDYAMRACG